MNKNNTNLHEEIVQQVLNTIEAKNPLLKLYEDEYKEKVELLFSDTISTLIFSALDEKEKEKAEEILAKNPDDFGEFLQYAKNVLEEDAYDKCIEYSANYVLESMMSIFDDSE